MPIKGTCRSRSQSGFGWLEVNTIWGTLFKKEYKLWMWNWVQSFEEALCRWEVTISPSVNFSLYIDRFTTMLWAKWEVWNFLANFVITSMSSLNVNVKLLSCVRLFATPWTVAYQGPLSMGFPRQEYCSGWPFPFPRDLPNPGIEPRSPALRADALPSEPPGKPKG